MSKIIILILSLKNEVLRNSRSVSTIVRNNLRIKERSALSINSRIKSASALDSFKKQIEDQQCLSIRNLKKVYKNANGGDDRIAVDDLSLDLFNGQVTVLLGHNGAGNQQFDFSFSFFTTHQFFIL